MQRFSGRHFRNFGSNLLVDTSSDYIVIEADEFDRSFLTLNPEKAVITSMDADHMDIYGNRDSIIAAFEDFACRVVPEGGLFIKKGLEIRKRRVDGFYSLNDKADFMPIICVWKTVCTVLTIMDATATFSI